MDYRPQNTQILETKGAQLLNSRGIKVAQSNLYNKRAPDYRKIGGGYIDFQYSCDFLKYGQEIRLDIVSAYSKKSVKEEELIARVEDFPHLGALLMSTLGVSKWGKIAEPRGVEELLYFFYNGPEEKIDFTLQDPDVIYFVPIEGLKVFIDVQWKDLLRQGRLKLNHKAYLGDDHGSAFIPIPLSDLERCGIGERWTIG